MFHRRWCSNQFRYGKKVFSIDAQVINDTFVHEEIAVKLNEIAFANKQEVINENAARNFQFFDTEMDKLDQWADDMKISLEKEIKDLDAEIKLKKGESKRTMQLEAKIRLQRDVKDLEKEK